MSKWAHADVLDGGLNGGVKTVALRMILIKAYAAGDSYATVTGNAVCTITMASGDFVLSGSAGSPRVCTVGAKSGTAAAASGATPDLHIALTDNVSKVLLVTDEITDVSVAIGNTVNFPSWTYSIPQPV